MSVPGRRRRPATVTVSDCAASEAALAPDRRLNAAHTKSGRSLRAPSAELKSGSGSLTKRVPARTSEAGPSIPAHLHFDECLQLVNVGRRPPVRGGENLDEPLRNRAHAIVTTCHSIWLAAFQPRLHRAGTPANRSPRMYRRRSLARLNGYVFPKCSTVKCGSSDNSFAMYGLASSARRSCPRAAMSGL
jgi:hypothetical protein